MTKDQVAKRIVVTGASVGLGLEMVRALARRGADITVIARHDEKVAAAEKLERRRSSAMRPTPA